MAYIPAATFPPHFHRENGALANGCTLTVFQAGTTTPAPLYLDEAGTPAGTSFVLNDRGEIEVSGNVIVPWLNTETEYKFTLTDPSSGQQWTVDDIITPVRQATESEPGIVRLYDDIDSFDSTVAATANALRIVAELAQQALAVASSGLPVGSSIPWPTEIVPNGLWMEEDGRSLLVAEYPELFTVLGYRYGGSGATFNLRDMRGRFCRGWSHGIGRDPDAAARTNRGDGTAGDNVGTLQESAMKAHFHHEFANAALSTSGGANALTADNFPARAENSTQWHGMTIPGTSTPSTLGRSSTVGESAGETRPVNINVMWIMKVRSSLS
jgi:microcystin-dependent protein